MIKRNKIGLSGLAVLAFLGCCSKSTDKEVQHYVPSSVIYDSFQENDSLRVNRRLQNTYSSLNVREYTKSYLDSLGLEGIYKESGIKPGFGDYYSDVAKFVYLLRKSDLGDSVNVFREEDRFGVDIYQQNVIKRYLLDRKLTFLNSKEKKDYILLKREKKK